MIWLVVGGCVEQPELIKPIEKQLIEIDFDIYETDSSKRELISDIDSVVNLSSLLLKIKGQEFYQYHWKVNNNPPFIRYDLREQDILFGELYVGYFTVSLKVYKKDLKESYGINVENFKINDADDSVLTITKRIKVFRQEKLGYLGTWIGKYNESITIDTVKIGIKDMTGTSDVSYLLINGVPKKCKLDLNESTDINTYSFTHTFYGRWFPKEEPCSVIGGNSEYKGKLINPDSIVIYASWGNPIVFKGKKLK